MTDIQKEIADKIVDYYKGFNGITISRGVVSSTLSEDEKYRNVEVRYVLHILTHKNILVPSDGVNKEHLFLSDKGWAYESYDKLIEEENKKAVLEIKQIESVIQTNTSVQEANKITSDNIKTQKNLTIISLIVAAASTLFAFGAMVVSLTDSTDEEVRQLNTQLQKLLQTTKNMQQSLKGIDTSMKNFSVEYPLNKDSEKTQNRK